MQITSPSPCPRSSPHGFADPYIHLRGVSQATTAPIRLDGAISLFGYYGNVPTSLVLWTPFLYRCSEPLFRPCLIRCANTGCPVDGCICASSQPRAQPLLTTYSQLGTISLLFRQTNIIWIIYVFAFHQISCLQWLRTHESQQLEDEMPLSKLYNPSALSASLCRCILVASLLKSHWYQGDIPQSIGSTLRLTKQLLPRLFPCASVCAAFVCFLVWNGGIVLGLYYYWDRLTRP